MVSGTRYRGVDTFGTLRGVDRRKQVTSLPPAKRGPVGGQKLDIRSTSTTIARVNAAEAAKVVAGEISESLTWTEICARYPDEWVCLVEMDYVHLNGPTLRAARIVGHGKTRGEPFQPARPWRAHYEVIGHYYTGRITERPPRPSIILDDETRDAIRYRR